MLNYILLGVDEFNFCITSLLKSIVAGQKNTNMKFDILLTVINNLMNL